MPTFNPWTDQPIETAACARLPDVTSLGAVLVKLDPASTDPALVPTLVLAFPGFEFRLAKSVMYWRDARNVIQPGGTWIGDL